MTKPNKTIELLEEILEEIRGLRADLARPAPEIPHVEPTPYFPNFPDPVPLGTGERRCPKCGISLGSVMGYVCNSVGCPIGLGPTTC